MCFVVFCSSVRLFVVSSLFCFDFSLDPAVVIGLDGFHVNFDDQFCLTHRFAWLSIDSGEASWVNECLEMAVSEAEPTPR